jgi:hypothetical protein
MRRFAKDNSASTLLIAVMTIAICSVLLGVYLRTLIPNFRSAHQGASWREALQGAESGVNVCIHELNQLASSHTTTDSYPWAAKGWSLVDAVFSLNGERILNAAVLPLLGGSGEVSVSRLALDVYTRQPDAPHHPWFRIRSTGRSELPDRYLSADRRDGRLRRMKLAAREAGQSNPFVERTVEVIVKPRHRFARAITTVSGLALGNSSSWEINSFDSSDPNRSGPGTLAGGTYPLDPAKRGANGNIASAEKRPANDPYGVLIRGNGAVVEGQVQTAGGDNPTTLERENVSGSSGMDQSKIRDDFDETIEAARQPSWFLPLPPPLGNTNFLTGPAAAPIRYVVPGNLGAFTVLPALPGTTGHVEILVMGNLAIGSGDRAQIVIPPNVNAKIYVKGNVDMGNGRVNSNADSSKVASHLTIYGLSTSPAATYSASGDAQQILTFYGPSYAVRLDGDVTTVGAMVAKSLLIDGGGSGGFHYDERWGATGTSPAGWW